MHPLRSFRRFAVKKIVISLVVLAVLIAGVFFALPAIIIDTDEMGQELTSALRDATGREVQISQTASVKLFPTPEVSYDGLTVSNVESASTQDFLSASKLTMQLSIMDLLSGSVQPSRIALDNATINFEVLPNGSQNWRFEGNGKAFSHYFLSTPVQLNKAAVNYVNAATGGSSQVTDTTGALQFEDAGKAVSFKGEVKLHGHMSDVMLRMSSVDMTGDATPEVPFQMVLEHLGSTFTANGRLSSVNRDPEFIGRVKMESSNLWSAVGLVTGKQPQDISGAPDSAVTAEGDIRLSTRRILVEEMDILAPGVGDIPVLKGKLDTEYAFGINPRLLVSANFETIDYDSLHDSYGKWHFTDPVMKGTEADAGMEDMDGGAITSPREEERDPLADMLNQLRGAVAINLDSFIVNGRSLNDIVLRADIQPGVVRLTRGTARMPGETVMSFAGELRKKEHGPTFDGKFQMQGKQMESFLSLFTPEGVTVPQLELGRFAMRTNLSLSSIQLRFSEFQALVSDTRMAGSLIFHRGDRLKLESYLRIANINIDTLFKTAQYLIPDSGGVKKNTTGAGGEQLFEAQYLNTSYNWLTSVGVDVDSDFYLQDFVLWKRKGETAKFNLQLGVGRVALADVDASYNESQITGTYAIEAQTNVNPRFTAAGTVSELDMVDLFPDLARARNDKEWQEYLDQQIELLALLTYRGEMKMRFGKLIMRNFEFRDVNAEALLENNVLSVDRFDATLWSGRIESRFRIMAGTIPSFSSSFRMANASLTRLAESTALLKHAAGNVNLSGQIATSGISLRSWYNNVQGEIRVQARDISVQGFGITTLALAVPVARTVNDVERAADIATNGGVTRMDTLQGAINVAEGKANIPQILFTSDKANGSVSGMVDLVNETVDLQMAFHLLNTVEAGEETPMLTLHMTGPIDNVHKDLETRELKNYVAQKAAQRQLGRAN